ncbi:DUF6455 family protein [Thalassovita aquimarina]|uniref:DUF6455 domain-containing protein n=1 Tax=Thalassovita aquimarina TaxID=2785917 RepID=A0ABS5HQ06_9RHOB|nr:DUF6455 family protein [Thalassovita aquimarina]MBR9650993.1 hypothetical protein [Thalassovita aquimarina]
MKRLGDRKRHYWLAQRMAQTTGTDLTGAYDAGDLSQQQWAEIVEACRGCDWTESCERWLARHETAKEAPAGCTNCGAYMEIRQAVSEGG